MAVLEVSDATESAAREFELEVHATLILEE